MVQLASGLQNLFGWLIKVPSYITDKPNYKWMGGLVDGLNFALLPILILVFAGLIFYSILLGVNLARAETTEKREEAKKRLIWCIIGVVSIFVLMLIMVLVMNNIGAILGEPAP